MSVNAAIYDPQPPGGTSGPIRFVTGAPAQASLDALGHPYAVIVGPVRGITGATHHVVAGLVTPLDGAPPVLPTPMPPPAD